MFVIYSINLKGVRYMTYLINIKSIKYRINTINAKLFNNKKYIKFVRCLKSIVLIINYQR